MKKTIFIITLFIVSLAGLGYLINTIPEIKTFAEKKIKVIAEEVGIINIPKVKIPDSYNAVFVIFDPSGSGRTTYSVPRITVKFMNELIDSIGDNGSGDIWLTFISRNAYNNDVLHLQIPKKTKALAVPAREPGERLGDFRKRLKKYAVDSLRITAQIHEGIERFARIRNKFLQKCQVMINAGYAPKKPGQDYSDIIGSMNAGLRVFSTIHSDSTHFRSILLISDGVQDVPRQDVHQTLGVIPEDVLCVEVNHTGSRKDILAGKALEIGNLDEIAINKVVRYYHPKNH